MTQPGTTHILINERSGGVSGLGKETCIELICEAVANAYGGDTQIASADGNPASLIEHARKLGAQNDNVRIITAGGDGTTTAIANVLSGSGAAFAPLPGGTMNYLPRDLGFHNDLREAIGQLGNLHKRDIDIACINDNLFLNNIALGAYPLATEAREQFRARDDIEGKVEAAVDLVGAITQSGETIYRISVEGVPKPIETNMVMVANNIYDGAELVAPTRSKLDEGQLGVYIAHPNSGLDFMAVLAELLTGNAENSAMIDTYKSESVKIETDAKAVKVAIDGEVKTLQTPLSISVRKKAVSVLAPAPA